MQTKRLYTDTVHRILMFKISAYFPYESVVSSKMRMRAQKPTQNFQTAITSTNFAEN